MAAITVLVGREEKEISGLTRKTTCSDVLQALLKEKHSEDKSTEKDDSIRQEDANNISSKSLRDFAKNYVIVENWRGCEKPLPPQTRILAVWQAWGKEQCHVKFSLKKNKNIDFRESRQSRKDESPSRYNNLINMMNHQSQQQADSAFYPLNLSHGQKKRIRRSLLQYQRAVLIQHTRESVDDNNNSGKQKKSTNSGEQNGISGNRLPSSRQKATETTKVTVTLSEEQFVDGVVTGPDCFMRHDGKSKFIRNALDNKEFNRERCTYRRPHHRRRSLMLEDSEKTEVLAVFPPHNLEDPHYPYCDKPKRRSISRRRRRQHSRKPHGRVSKQSRKHRYSTDSTTSTGTASTASEMELESSSDGEDADDEKSIMTEFRDTISRQKMISYPRSLLPANRYSSGTVSTSTATATDSSSGATTCSETSNTSGSSISGTSSCDTSSSGDIFGESLFLRRAELSAITAAKAPEKPKSSNGAAKLFRKVAGPSFTKPLLGSFKKKRKAPQPPQPNPATLIKTVDNTQATKSKNTKPAVAIPNAPVAVKESLPIRQQIETTEGKTETNPSVIPSSTSGENRPTDNGVTPCENHLSSECAPSRKSAATDDEENQKSLDQLQQLILSQEKILNSRHEKVKSTDAEIERIESQVHRWRTQAHGKNYVQDTYLSGLETPLAVQENVTLSPASSRASKCIYECKESKQLSEYVELCERVVGTQMRIEECKRNAEIILQDMQDEVWKAGDVGTVIPSNPLTAAALGLTSINGDEDADSSDDESGLRLESLSVSTGKPKKSTSSAEMTKTDNSEDSKLEVERSRTELEANLYLSLRLSTELEEVDQLMCTSQQLLQSKGETLLNLVREMSQCPEGISAELWQEYGELLMAYDAEMALQRYLAACAESDNVNRIHAESQATILEEAQSIHLSNAHDLNPLSPTTTALHHALSPWLWCEHCKHELEQQQQRGLAGLDSQPMSPHWLNHSAIPPTFSDLPLPSPSLIKDPPPPVRPVTPLLPMPPIPNCNDSDYEDFPDRVNCGNDMTSAIISTESATPVVFRHHPPLTGTNDLLSSRNSATNTDDSGNASAGSTASFASTNSDASSTDNGSRNSSCDGGSPRPPSISTESQDSAQSSPFSLHCGFKRGSGKSKFIFPPKLSNEEALRFFSKATRSATKASSKTKSSMPFEHPPYLSAPTSPATFDSDRCEQQKKLIRRNSNRTKRTAPAIPEPFGKRATSFGKGAVKPSILPSHLSNILKKPTINNSHGNLTPKSEGSMKQGTAVSLRNKHLKNCPSPLHFFPSSGVAPPSLRSPASAPCSPFVGHQSANMHCRDPRRPHLSPIVSDIQKKSPVINENMYDNDSDTGLSSLHSTDSVDMLNMYSETLV